MINTKLQSIRVVSKLEELVNKVLHKSHLVMHPNKYGPKIFNQHEMVALLILKHRSRLSYRDFVLFLHESKWPEWLGLSEIPSKSTLHNYFLRIGMKVIRWLNRIAVAMQEAVRLSIDATGIETNVASKHYERRIEREKIPYLKLSILADSDSLLIHDWISEERHVHDVIHAERIFKRSKLRGIPVFADKGYDSNKLMEICYDKKSLLYCPIRNFKVPYPSGYFRQEQYERFDKKTYNSGRNPVECIMSLIKHNKLVIRAKKLRYKYREMAWCILSYNLERMAKAIKLILSRRLWTGPSIYKYCD